jgi:cytochrome c oxidase subunit I
MGKFLRPHIIFVITGCILVVIGILSHNKTTDIHLHDTYFVISQAIVFFTLAGLVFIYAVIYLYFFTIRILLSRILTVLHLFGVIVSLYILLFYQPDHADISVPRRYIDMNAWQKFNWFIVLGVTLFLIANLCFIVNLIGGILRQLKENRKVIRK